MCLISPRFISAICPLCSILNLSIRLLSSLCLYAVGLNVTPDGPADGPGSGMSSTGGGGGGGGKDIGGGSGGGGGGGIVGGGMWSGGSGGAG